MHSQLRIKIERLRQHLNKMNYTDRKKLLAMSQRLDKLIVEYQRQISSLYR